MGRLTEQAQARATLLPAHANENAVLQEWLAKEGSPHSRIDRCEFSRERSGLAAPEYAAFEVRRGGGS